MRIPVASLTKKFVSLLFAAALAFGLMPGAAFAADDSLSLIPEGDGDAASIASSAEGGSNDVFSHCPSDEAPSADGGSVATSSEDVLNNDFISQDVELDTVVAQAEFTKSYFLAQTLESTRTIPMVSASLPMDVSQDVLATEEADGASNVGVSPASTVIGSFEYLGMTFAVEPDGASVALVAADYSKLPQQFIEKQVLVIPKTATPDGIDYYSVTRIADYAFASFERDIADLDYTGCESLLSDENLLMEADVDIVDYEDDGPLAGCPGILVLSIPKSITAIEDDAFAGFETLQYFVVSDDNSDYSSYDGALYDADLTELLYVPEGRVGTVCVASSAAEASPEILSSCPFVEVMVTKTDDSVFQSEHGFSSMIGRLVGVMMNDSDVDRPFSTQQQPNELNEPQIAMETKTAYSATTYAVKYKNTASTTCRMDYEYQQRDSSNNLNITERYVETISVDKTVNATSIWINTTNVVLGVNEAQAPNNTGKYTHIRFRPSRTGYTCTGWTWGGTTYRDGVSVTLKAGDITPVWSGNTIKITWNSNGGSSVADTTKTYSDTAKVTLPTAPTRAGYVFKGWYTSASDGTIVTSSTPLPNKNTTYYAQWAQYDPSDSKYVSIYTNTTSVWRSVHSTPYQTRVEAPTQYTYRSSTSANAAYAPDRPFSKLLYRTDELVATGIKNDLETKSYIGLTYSATDNKIGGITSIWMVYEDEHGVKRGKYLTDGVEVPISDCKGNVSLYFNNSRQFTIYTNNNHDASADTSRNAMPYMDLGTWSAPTRKGYRFTGWYTEPTGGVRVERAGETTTHYYAHWEPDGPLPHLYSPTGTVWRTIHAQDTGEIEYKAAKFSIPYEPYVITDTVRLDTERGCLLVFGFDTGTLRKDTVESFGLDEGISGVTSAWAIGTTASGEKHGFSIDSDSISVKEYLDLDIYLNGYGALDITWDANGGECEISRSEGVMPYDVAFEFPVPVREGCTFRGWYTTPDGESKVTSVQGTSATYYALWVKNTPYAHFISPTGATTSWIQNLSTASAIGSVNPHVATVEEPYTPLGMASTIKLNAGMIELIGTRTDTLYTNKYGIGIEQTGDKAVGGVQSAWLVGTDASGNKTGVALDSDEMNVVGYEDVHVFLNGAGSFNISFDSNRGNEGIQTVSGVMPYGQWTAPSATRSGYVIRGWYDGPDADANFVCSANGIGSGIGETTTLYAHWAPVSAAVVPLNVTAKVDLLGVADQEAVLDADGYQGYIESRSEGALKVTKVDFTPFAGADELFGIGRDRVLLEALAQDSTEADYSFSLDEPASETDTAKLEPFALDAGIGTKKRITYRFAIPSDVLAGIDRSAFNNKTTSVGRVAYTVAVVE